MIDLGYRTHFRWDPETRREIMHFGRWILGSSVASFVAPSAIVPSSDGSSGWAPSEATA